MPKLHKIEVYEHERLYLGDQGFKQTHLDALLKLNDYHQGTYFQPIHKGIKFSQFVGIIQVDGLTIEIHPKADKYGDNLHWRGVLIKMLKATGRLKADTTGGADVRRQHLNLLEVYFEMYLLEVNSLIRKGLVKKYRRETNNVKALKGKLDFAGNIRCNVVRKERFYTTHQVYDQDHLLHQILHCALKIVEQFTKGERLADLAKRVLLNFPETKSISVSAKQVNGIILDRKTISYSYALELARLIILNYSPDISKGNERMLSLLFDMNVLWEDYVLRQLQNVCKGTTIKVVGQESRAFWGSTSLRPDIVLKKGNRTYVVDTKWKLPENSSASIADVRQMYAYARYWDANEVVLLYPGQPKKTDFKKFLTEDYSFIDNRYDSMNHKCKMGFVSVLNSEGNDLDLDIGHRILEELDLIIAD